MRHAASPSASAQRLNRQRAMRRDRVKWPTVARCHLSSAEHKGAHDATIADLRHNGPSRSASRTGLVSNGSMRVSGAAVRLGASAEPSLRGRLQRRGDARITSSRLRRRARSDLARAEIEAVRIVQRSGAHRNRARSAAAAETLACRADPDMTLRRPMPETSCAGVDRQDAPRTARIGSSPASRSRRRTTPRRWAASSARPAASRPRSR